MELDELKKIWQHYDESLQETRIMNEKIMRTMLHDKSRSQMSKILISEYLSIAVAAIVFIIFLMNGWRVAGVLLPYIISLLFCAGSMVWSYRKIQYIGKTDIGNRPVTESLERLEKLRLMIVKEKLWFFILTPILVMSLVPVLQKWLFNVNALDNLWDFIPRILIACAAILACSLWLYKKIYFKSISAIVQNLKEIESFKNEDHLPGAL